MARILRGNIVWADLDPARGHEQGGQRPVVVWEISSVKLPKRSWVKISQIRTLSIERIGKKAGRVSPEELARLIEGVNEILGA